jgi:hypothetical protein
MLAALLTSARDSGRIVASCSGRPTWLGIHPCLKILPAFLGNHDLGRRQLAHCLSEGMQEDDQALGTPVEHSVVLGAHVAAQFPQLSIDLGAVREREMWHRVGEIVQPIELAQQGRPTLGVRSARNSRTGSAPSVER